MTSKFASLISVIAGVSVAMETGEIKRPLHPREIYGKSADLDGTVVIASGYVVEGHCLYTSRRRFADFKNGFRRGSDEFEPGNFASDGVTLLGMEKAGYPLRSLNGNIKMLRGILRTNYLNGKVLDLRACGRAALVISDEEARRAADLLASPRQAK